LSFDYEFTGEAGHAIELARAAVDNGCRYLIAVGGDGTVHEVANGILTSAAPDTTIMGVLSGGTACSFARSLGLPQDISAACKVLTGEGRLKIDVGFVEYISCGENRQRFFVNVADVGFGAAIIHDVKDLPGLANPTVYYYQRLLKSFESLYHYQNKHVTLDLENESDSIRACIVLMANGRYSGGGLNMAPQARFDDGLLDMVIAGDIGKLELLGIVPTLYDGKHIAHPKVSVKQVTGGTIQTSECVLLEADGELLGECPVSFRVIPSALTVVV
jgi:YegS/Rv2252/BmrU family lipid kinase